MPRLRLFCFRHISTSGLPRNGRNGCRWPIFGHNARITLRSGQQTGAECYGTSADQITGILLPDPLNVNIRRRMSHGVLFCRPEAFGLLTCEFRRQYFAVSVKPEVAVSRPEVVLRDRKWLSPTATVITPSVKEFSVSSPSPLLFSIYWARTCRPIEACIGRPLQVTVRPMLRDRCPDCHVCLSVTLVFCGQTVGWNNHLVRR